jgi:hypothetical protein
MVKKNVVILNAPPEAGKDALADYLKQKYPTIGVESFKKPIRDLVKIVYNLTDEKIDYFYERDRKDVRFSRLNHQSIREVYIHMSEKVIKPNFGDDFFGQSIRKRMLESDKDIFVIPDGGFASELLPLVHDFNVVVIRIHREGYNFNNDSRSYLNGKMVPSDVGFMDLFNKHGGVDENGNFIYNDETFRSFLEDGEAAFINASIYMNKINQGNKMREYVKVINENLASYGGVYPVEDKLTKLTNKGISKYVVVYTHKFGKIKLSENSVQYVDSSGAVIEKKEKVEPDVGKKSSFIVDKANAKYFVLDQYFDLVGGCDEGVTLSKAEAIIDKECDGVGYICAMIKHTTFSLTLSNGVTE